MTHRIEEAVIRGMCIGCGACSAATQGAIPVKLGELRLYQADLSGVSEDDIRVGSRVCPFSDEAPDEDALAIESLGAARVSHPLIGRYTRTLAGRVTDEEYLRGSSSGGLASWLASMLVESGKADAVINVGRPGPTRHELFGYGITTTPRLSGRRKSQYYASTMAEVLLLVADSDKRFALVGLPCFIKAARSLCRERPEYAARLVSFIALVCGHYKTQAYSESLAWQVGVPPSSLVDVDFRIKVPGRPSSDYDFGARQRGEDGWRHRPTRELVGSNWGHNAFQPEACNFCDDVVGETADVSLGDAWLPRFVSDSRGTNLVISRDPAIDAIMDQGARTGQITIESLSPDEVVQSQAGGFRHRREGLALRLADDLAAGLSVPIKRVEPDASGLSKRRAALVRQRRRMALLSHQVFVEAMAAGDLQLYVRVMRAEASRYRRLEASWSRRVWVRLKQAVVKLGRQHPRR